MLFAFTLHLIKTSSYDVREQFPPKPKKTMNIWYILKKTLSLQLITKKVVIVCENKNIM